MPLVSEPPIALLLVRHALPLHNVARDPGLAAEGYAQAARLGVWLAHDRPAAVVSSPSRRAVETAQAVADPLGLPVRLHEGLREWGEPIDRYVLPESPEADAYRGAALREGRFEEFIPDHDVAAFQARVTGAVREIAGSAEPGERLVVVSHGGAINAVLADVIGARSSFFFNPGYTSVSALDLMPDGRLVLCSVNETGHLSGRRPSVVEPRVVARLTGR